MACRWLCITATSLVVAGCNGEIYVRDGVTDGDTFYLAERALHDSDPVLQSWVSYSLMKSACQLEIGAENPARATSFECELTAREHLLESWAERSTARTLGSGRYLDELRQVQDAGWLPEYVWHHFGKRSWRAPADLDVAQFEAWCEQHLPGHEPETRLVGAWGYARRSGSR